MEHWEDFNFMRIKNINVKGLFGVFNHEISMFVDDRITIIHGPNGFGKTTILKMVDALFNSRFYSLSTIPFKEFKVIFDNESIIKVTKSGKTDSKTKSHRVSQLIITYTQNDTNEELSFQTNRVRDIEDIEFPMSIIERTVPQLTRVGANVWRDMVDDEILPLEEVIERYGHLLPFNHKKDKKVPEWFNKITESFPVRFVQAQRLFAIHNDQRLQSEYSKSQSMQLSVALYSKELSANIKSRLAEYASLSQSLDRTFPARVVNQDMQNYLTDEELRNKLTSLEEKRLRFVEAGLLDKDEKGEFQVPTEIDEKTKSVLSVYVKDVQEKLGVLDEIADRIDIFKKVLDPRFQYKKMIISKDKGIIFTTLDGSNLSPSDLSSGEQHEIVLLYELLFKVAKDSLILIDEPELSLHVAWQEQFLKDLQEIIRLSNFDVLIATHSPQIIYDRWDLTVELRGIEK